VKEDKTQLDTRQEQNKIWTWPFFSSSFPNQKNNWRLSKKFTLQNSYSLTATSSWIQTQKIALFHSTQV